MSDRIAGGEQVAVQIEHIGAGSSKRDARDATMVAAQQELGRARSRGTGGKDYSHQR